MICKQTVVYVCVFNFSSFLLLPAIQLGMALAPLVLPQIAYSPDDIPRAVSKVTPYLSLIFPFSLSLSL